MKKTLFVIFLSLLVLVVSCAPRPPVESNRMGEEMNEPTINTFVATSLQAIDQGNNILLKIFFTGTVEEGMNAVVVMKSGQESFVKTIAISASDVMQESGNSYIAISIPKQEVMERLSQVSSITVTLNSNEGKLGEVQQQVQFSLLADQSVVQAYEQQFYDNAKSLNKKSNSKYFTVSVARLGYYTHLANINWGPEVKHFRVDVTITNKDSNARDIDLSTAKVVYKGRTYNIVAVRDSGEIFKPGKISIKEYESKNLNLLFEMPSMPVQGTYEIYVGRDVADNNNEIKVTVFV